MRLFLDTNVLVSAFTSRGVCADLFREILAHHLLFVSEDVLSELKRVLTERFGTPTETVREILILLRTHNVVLAPEIMPSVSIRDPDDLRILAAAMACQADVLVSGDRDLLSLMPFEPLPILSPRDCLDRLNRLRLG